MGRRDVDPGLVVSEVQAGLGNRRCQVGNTRRQRLPSGPPKRTSTSNVFPSVRT
ncbi:hypothetical protein [Dactylosporangium sp. CA-139066]|uniref:hypothetical protein n=1 Tax=Dactylosporangium sp. CA-139066 TaxID=3239930 RepID=UPI003D8F5080